MAQVDDADVSDMTYDDVIALIRSARQQKDCCLTYVRKASPICDLRI
jgi:hypothetical protein